MNNVLPQLTILDIPAAVRKASDSVGVRDILDEAERKLVQRHISSLSTMADDLYRHEHIRRKRPSIYVDFRDGVVRRRSGGTVRLPRTLAIRVLEHLLRHPCIDPVDFCLLPRSKQPLGLFRQKDARKAFSKEVSVLRRFLTDNHLQVQILACAERRAYVVCAGHYVSSNIHTALEIAEHGRHQLDLGARASAMILAKQALIIDPDCDLAARLVLRLIRDYPAAQGLPECVTRTQNFLTRRLLGLASTAVRMTPSRRKGIPYTSVSEKAHQRLRAVTRQLRVIWNWRAERQSSAIGPYAEALSLMAESGLEGLGKKPATAFEKLLAIPQVADAMRGFGASVSTRKAEEVTMEAGVRFWRLVLVDGWIPNVLDIEGYAIALQQEIRRRLRFSNTPDGERRTFGTPYQENLRLPEEQDEEEGDAFE